MRRRQPLLSSDKSRKPGRIGSSTSDYALISQFRNFGRRVSEPTEHLIAVLTAVRRRRIILALDASYAQPDDKHAALDFLDISTMDGLRLAERFLGIQCDGKWNIDA